MYKLGVPSGESEWNEYYHLRWVVLRKPHGQLPGTEKDDQEDTAIHLALWDDSRIVAIGRIHRFDELGGQIRYMAVSESYRNKGLGSIILNNLILEAKNQKMNRVILNARESAVQFYERHGFIITGPAPTLFGEIPHFAMEKII